MNFLSSIVGWKAWALGGVAALLAIGGLYLWLTKAEESDDRRNQDIGRTIQREDDLRETIERVEQGNEARNDIRNYMRAKYDVCMRHDKGAPDSCRRFLP